MTEIESLVLGIEKKEPFSVLHNLCKKLREKGVPSDEISKALMEYDFKDKEDEDTLYDLMDALCGYCNSKYSLK